MSNNIPLSLYIHIPWCVRKCPYCDFNSHRLRQHLPEQEYLNALKKDFDAELVHLQQRSIQSIFIGGGTPSLFSAAAIADLLAYIAERATLSDDIEVTMEANPGTFEQEKFKAFRQAGITRLSIGIQSFEQEKLTQLGRIHDSAQAKKAIDIAKIAGFDSFNIDLMFALPEQTLSQALADLQQGLDFKPDHISWYQLTLEPNTAFYFKPPTLPDHDESYVIQQAGQALLAEHGYQHYEVSAYAKANKQCRHNLNYWQFGDYLAIGAGAYAKITDLASGVVKRYHKHRHPTTYMKSENSFIADSTTIATQELAFEFMLNALRLQQKIPVALFEQRTGLTLVNIEAQLKQAAQKQLLQYNDQEIECLPLGRRFLDDTIQCFLNFDGVKTTS